MSPLASEAAHSPFPHSQAECLRLYGSTQAPATPLLLAAGALRCSFEGGAIRDLRWQGVEILRGISYLLRDRNWGTAPAVLEHCAVEQGEDFFRLRFALRMATPEGTLLARAAVDGTAAGQFSFRVEAQPDAPLATNRCGFVLLHPASAAGAPLLIEHTDASLEATAFPLSIGPGQVALRIRRLRHTPRPGWRWTACCRPSCPTTRRAALKWKTSATGPMPRSRPMWPRC